jgi:SAM-dependent methyltransferase
MNHQWWRTHLRTLPELGFLGSLGSFNEVDEWMPFLTGALDLPESGRVLDLGCGRGSFAVRFAQWGYDVLGVEESEPMLAIARESAARWQVTPEFRKADLRSIPERSLFDGALMLDFGTFADVENAEMMRAVAAALKPGGRVVFCTVNPYYWSREPRTEHRVVEGTDIIRRFQFDFPTASVRSRVRFIQSGGQRTDLPAARYRAYTIPELRGLILATGLADLQICGEDEDGIPQAGEPVDALDSRFFHCTAVRPVTGESGEGI